MIYVVTGRHRTGTSMMMAALTAGGLSPVHSVAVEADIRSRVICDYDPNPDGFWPAPRGVFPHDLADGELVKCPVYAWRSVNPGDYRVVRMVRDEAVRSASFTTVFGAQESIRSYELGEEHLLERDDCQIVTLNYDTVVADPAIAFGTLVDAGWPIDAAAARAVVNG
jgi:hypothetical protein